MLQDGTDQMRLQLCIVQFGIAKHDFVEVIDGLAVRPGGDSAVNKSLIVDVLIGQIQYRLIAQAHLEGRVDTDTVETPRVDSVISGTADPVIDAFGRAAQADHLCPLNDSSKQQQWHYVGQYFATRPAQLRLPQVAKCCAW